VTELSNPGVASPPRSAARVSVSELSKAALLYAALTVMFAYPLSIHPGSTLFGDNPDTHLYIYTLAWDSHAFVRNPFGIFDASFYYPNRLTLAYSENSIGSAFFAAPILWASGNPVLALNLTQLIACVLCGIGAYVLARSVGLASGGALVCGLVFAFAPTRFVRTGQLYLGTLQWMPLTLASLHDYFAGRGKWSLRLAAAFFTLQAYTSGHGAVFLALAMLALVAYRVVFGERLAIRQRLRELGVPGLLFLAPAALLYWPYRQVQVEMGLRRSLEDWAPTWQSFIASPTHVQQWLLSFVPTLRVNEEASAYLFPGFVPLLLAAIALVAWRRDRRAMSAAMPTPLRWRLRGLFVLDGLAFCGVLIAVLVATSGPIRFRAGNSLVSIRDVIRPLALVVVIVLARTFLARGAKTAPGRFGRLKAWWRVNAARLRDDAVVFYTIIAIVGLWASIGPPLGLWPLIYWLPGLNFIRVPSRFMLLGLIGIAVLAGFGYERMSSRVSAKHRGWMASTIILLLIVEFAAMPLPVAAYRLDIPPIDRWLATRPAPFSVAEFPVTMSVRQQTTYMLHSMAHWQKTIHGFSGFEAPLHTTLYRQLRAFPDEVSLQRLRDLGITYLVVHGEYYPSAEWTDVQERLRRFGDQLSLEHEEGTARVYSLRGGNR
jgi:hypothetical protein